MPAIKIICNLTTAPLASDDMHIAVIILGFYRFIQFICIAPLLIAYLGSSINGSDYYINGVPHWCTEYQDMIDEFNTQTEERGGRVPIFSTEKVEINEDPFISLFLSPALGLFAVDVAWLVMVWASSSVGTPTEPYGRDRYIRNLLKFKMFFSNLYPIALVALGITYVHLIRADNYGCGENGEVIPGESREDTPYYGLFCAFLVLVAMELLVWPAMLMNKITKALKFRRNRTEQKAFRFELKFGCLLKLMSCCFGKKMHVLKYHGELKNKGELKDFASQLMCLLNNETKMGLVLTDMYCGFKMLSRVQGERKVRAIKKLAKKNKSLLLRLTEDSNDNNQQETINESSDQKCDSMIENEEPKQQLLRRRRSSIMVLQLKEDTESYELCEREILHASVKSDIHTMSDGAIFIDYARCVYLAIMNCVATKFREEGYTEEDNVFRDSIKTEEEECLGFTRDLDTLFEDTFRLTTIGLGHASLCYSNFVNGIAPTPYSILVDHERKAVVVTIRGTLSIEDLVVDVQFVPESLDKVGTICGFDGTSHYCHKGILVRCKWMYNDIKKTRVLKTLFSKSSPYKDFDLVLCGHSLGAGCASVLSVMLKPSFPLLQCFAYEPPGAIFNEELSNHCSQFVTSFVRHDDFIPRLSYHNFEALRNEFFTTFQRIKVPKIKLYFHLKTPYQDRFVAARNAQVLRAQGDIPLDTEFSQQLEKLRAERADKNTKKSMKPLFIPGKIIHLVDTSGTENKGTYVPYWASRDEFNQIEISKRMYSDHDVHSLVDILKDIELGGTNTASLAFHDKSMMIMQDDGDDDTAEADITLFSCCSNPYGKLPLLLAVLTVVASSLSSSSAGCEFLNSSFPSPRPDYYDGMVNVTWGLSAYSLLNCVDVDNSTGVCTLFNDNVCVPYPPKLDFTAAMTSARVFSVMASILVGIVMIMLLGAMCFIIKQRTWMIITVMLLLATLFQGLVFIMKREFSYWCSEPEWTCHLGNDAYQNIAGCCFNFAIAVGTGYLARVGKRYEDNARDMRAPFRRFKDRIRGFSEAE